MNEEIDESEFYHQDFTTASEWEVFIARVEEVIHDWKTEEKKLNTTSKETTTTKNDNWKIRMEKVPFADVEFNLVHYKHATLAVDGVDDSENALEDAEEQRTKNPMDNDYDFSLQNSVIGANGNEVDDCLFLWYGLKEFLIIKPASFHSPLSESRMKILLSSAIIVLSNLGLETPIFVQLGEKWQCLYRGVHEGNGLRTHFEMVHLRRGPQHCQYLTGLLDMFKTKILSPISLEPIDISVQLTYQLHDFGKFVWKQELPDVDVESFDSTSLCMLPFGVTFDPLQSIVLRAKWSHLSDNLIVDSENYSDFDPLNAPLWTLQVTTSEQPVSLLADCLTDFLHLLGNGSTIYDVLGDFVNTNIDTNNPLDLLTESKVPTISSVLKRAARSSLTKPIRKGPAPLTEEILVPMLYFLFPDAEEEPLYPYNTDKETRDKEGCSLSFHEGESEGSKSVDAQYRGYKTSASDSLVWRLSIVLAQSLHTLGGQRALAHLWFEFVQEMRYRWEKCITVPGLAPGFPDPRTCLLHQKLQMLNCCIDRKRAREQTDQSSDFLDSKDSTDEDEFFDCEERQHSLWNQPVGRLGRFENLRLLKTGDPLYVPVTQDPVPKTEDQLEEDTDVLLKLGSDAQGSELRAKMMSASLLSDMESFKAANPGGVLEDFIRWYSPRDWLEEDVGPGVLDEWGQKKGRLSSRMLIAGNTWVEMWESAKPVSAGRQKRLFDDTREAEKVLHFLDSRSLAQIAELFVPVLAHAAIYRLDEEAAQVRQELPQNSVAVKAVLKTGERLSREGQVNIRRFENLVQEIAQLELEVSQVNSLQYKFNPAGTNEDEISGLVGSLILGQEVPIESTSGVGERMLTMFSDAQKVANLISNEQFLQGHEKVNTFPPASEREFVMRVLAHRPAAYSAKSPQFLRAVLSRNEFRLVGAFTEDIVFF